MSGLIRQLIGPTRVRLRNYLEEVATFLSTNAKETTQLEDKKFSNRGSNCAYYKQYFYSRGIQ